MNSQRIKQNWSNLTSDKKDHVLFSLFKLAISFRMTTIIDKKVLKDPESTKNGQIEIDTSKIYTIIIKFDVNEIHIMGNRNVIKSITSHGD